jgi:hypothetical protein
MFALDSIESAITNNEEIQTVDIKLIEDIVGKDFGIYSGGERQWANLKFTPIQARWIQSEEWHPEQKSTTLEDGSLILEVPLVTHKNSLWRLCDLVLMLKY